MMSPGLSWANLWAVIGSGDLSMMKVSSTDVGECTSLAYFLNKFHEYLASLGYASQSLPRMKISPFGPVNRMVLLDNVLGYTGIVCWLLIVVYFYM